MNYNVEYDKVKIEFPHPEDPLGAIKIRFDKEPIGFILPKSGKIVVFNILGDGAV